MHKKGQWSTFICILALASVIDQKIVCYYPDFGDAKIKALFNQLIVSRSFYVNPSSSGFFKINHIFFCQLGTQGHDFSKANHFVPLILNKNSQRSKKRVLSSAEVILNEARSSKKKKISNKPSSTPFFGKKIYSFFQVKNSNLNFHSVPAVTTASVITVSSSNNLCMTSSASSNTFSSISSVAATKSSYSSKINMNSKISPAIPPLNNPTSYSSTFSSTSSLSSSLTSSSSFTSSSTSSVSSSSTSFVTSSTSSLASSSLTLSSSSVTSSSASSTSSLSSSCLSLTSFFRHFFNILFEFLFNFFFNFFNFLLDLFCFWFNMS